MNKATFEKIFPWAVVGLAALYLVATAMPRDSVVNGFNLQEFGRLPVQDGGRIKPIDTMARTSLYAISGRQSFVDNNDTTQPAVKWYLDVITTAPGRGGRGLDYKTFRIENIQLLSLLGLEQRSGFRYAISEFKDNWEAFEREANKAHAKPPDTRDVYEAKLVELQQHVVLVLRANQSPALHLARPHVDDRPPLAVDREEARRGFGKQRAEVLDHI